VTETPESGKDRAIEIAERSVISSILASDGGEIPKIISRLIDFSPNSFEDAYVGQVADAIKRSRKNGTAPTLIEILPLLTGPSVALAQELCNLPSALPLALADSDAEPLLKRWQSRKLIAVLGEAWEEARSHPDKAGTVSKSIIRVIEDTMSESPERRLPVMVDSALFVKLQLPRSPHIVHGLLHKGTKIVIGGGSKSFKTWIQLDLAMSIAYGLPWMGFETTPGKVLFVNFEIKEEFFQDRLIKMASAKGVNLEEGRLIVWNLRGQSAPYHEIVPKMIEDLHKTDFSLVILDPVYKLYGNTDENSASQVALLMNALETMCVKTEAAVGFGAHYSKGNQAAKEAIDRISGSGVFARDPDSIINFTIHEEKEAFTVEPTLRNLPPVEPFVVRWKFPLMVRDDELDPTDLKQAGPGKKKYHEAHDFLRFIILNDSKNPVSISDWSERAKVPRRTLTDYIPEMRAKGWVITIGEGKSARQSITPLGITMANGGN